MDGSKFLAWVSYPVPLWALGLAFLAGALTAAVFR